ncbi:glycosyl transferase [Streptomyces abyssalis]|uniref:D-inositol 3-phosphate glycosyltransferase n=1 Tax=Streptomyces abyssalis TaxID=933944 RepID=A0A1E7JFA0_9ACTN|nr:glycosyltransferase [Streptomyces abyssalis]OEU85142.1 glycosyl transferase [Streptomyces abyssalis]OEU95565.1 glycosyl transferase [Streptomyces abyssalis]OEV29039.1 glycosyl transferase [Streptomyces nanshensis]
MKVAHIITGLGVGGAEQQLRLMLRHLPARCDVFTLTAPGSVAEGILADGHRVTHLGMSGNLDATVMPLLVHLLREGRYDLVHTHLYRACLYGRLAARLAGVRAVVATEHSLGDDSIEGRPLTLGVRALYLASERLGSATVAVSDTVAKRLRRWGVPAARLHTVPNGIDARRFRFDPAARAATRRRLGIPEDTFVVGGVGRLVPGKHFETLVRAVAVLPDARLLLAGDGPERDTLHGIASALGALDRIHMLGECDGTVAPSGGGSWQVPDLLSAMDVFVSPSSDEAFGLAVLEALAAGLPALHVTCPAIDDLPSEQAPGARRIGTGVPELTALLCEYQKAGPVRLPVPAVVDRYDIARSAERLMAVYHAATGAPQLPATAPSAATPVPAPTSLPLTSR